MTLDEFRATRRACDDEMWGILVAEGVMPPSREATFVYGEGYVLHEADGKFWTHAWWYRPHPKDTLAEAEETLFEWRKEWV